MSLYGSLLKPIVDLSFDHSNLEFIVHVQYMIKVNILRIHNPETPRVYRLSLKNFMVFAIIKNHPHQNYNHSKYKLMVIYPCMKLYQFLR